MTKQDILDKAIYIQFPVTYGGYKEYNIPNVNRLPLPKKGEMYDNWPLNHNHFTTEYHRKNVIPLLNNILHLNYNENDFTILPKSGQSNNCSFDISLLKPKKEYVYEVFGYNRNEHFDNLSFDDLTRNDSKKGGITDYHRMYKYGHESSRLINKTLEKEGNNRILFLSGDSQLIPDIAFLSCFFKEIFYIDNRDRLSLADKYKDVEFTDIIIEINNNPIKQYTEVNLS